MVKIFVAAQQALFTIQRDNNLSIILNKWNSSLNKNGRHGFAWEEIIKESSDYINNILFNGNANNNVLKLNTKNSVDVIINKTEEQAKSTLKYDPKWDERYEQPIRFTSGLPQKDYDGASIPSPTTQELKNSINNTDVSELQKFLNGFVIENITAIGLISVASEFGSVLYKNIVKKEEVKNTEIFKNIMFRTIFSVFAILNPIGFISIILALQLKLCYVKYKNLNSYSAITKTILESTTKAGTIYLSASIVSKIPFLRGFGIIDNIIKTIGIGFLAEAITENIDKLVDIQSIIINRIKKLLRKTELNKINVYSDKQIMKKLVK